MTEPPAPAVIKVGGSVLRDGADYEAIAGRLRPWLARGAWVVVSAGYGVTDELQRIGGGSRRDAVSNLVARHARWAGEPLATGLAAELAAAANDGSAHAATLLSWGERASAAVLRSRLSRAGMQIPVVELPSRGLPRSRAAAIVPGFYVRDALGRVHLLPRGGSDISAVILASRLGAREVRLWKNGGGIRDPANPASTLRDVDGGEFLARMGNGIRPLHPAALRIALQTGLDLVLEDPLGRSPSTRIRAPVARGPPPIRAVPAEVDAIAFYGGG